MKFKLPISDDNEEMVRVQIPLTKGLRQQLKIKSESIGFDSLQAYIRFILKAAADGRHFDFNVDAIPSQQSMRHWVATQKLFQYLSAQEIEEE